MAKGIIYVLKNYMFKDNIVKIGKTERNLEKRIKELNRQTGVPFPFTCSCAFEFEDYSKIEKLIHTAYRSVGAQTDEKNQKKEFFEVHPEKVREFLSTIADLHKGKELMVSDNKIYSKEEVSQIKQENDKEMRKPTRFSDIGIEVGDVLTYTRDNNVTCEVVEDNKVKYDDKIYSMSGLTRTIMSRNKNIPKTAAYNGYSYWKYKDEILWDLRKRLEDESIENEL